LKSFGEAAFNRCPLLDLSKNYPIT